MAEARKSNAGAANGSPGGPRAMSRVLSLFELLARQRSGLSLTEISQSLDVPKSTFLSSLRALAADGHLICENNFYRLGPTAFRLAGTIMSAWSAPDIIRHYLRELAQATSESVGYAIADWEIGQVIYADAVNSTQPVHYAMRVGIRAPLYASAAGRVLLAFAPPEKRKDYLSRTQFKALTPSTRTTAESVLESLRSISTKGYCASFGEMLQDTAAIAVPVYDTGNNNIGALMIAAPLNRMRGNFDFLLGQLMRAGRQASGLHPDDPGPSAPDL